MKYATPNRRDHAQGTRRLDAVVRERFDLSWAKARERITKGKIWIDGVQVVDIGYRLIEGRDFKFMPDARVDRLEDKLLPPKAFCLIDRDIVVLEKQAGILTVPFEKTDRYSLVQLLRVVLSRRDCCAKPERKASAASVFVVHRLDKGTSGLLVFARTRLARDRLKDQFRAHTVHRRYVALVQGIVSSTTVKTHLVRDRGDGTRGSVEKVCARARRKLSRGRIAITHVHAVEALRGATLVRCQLETGRTNQIRIHLSELGHPVVGETVYQRDLERAKLPASRLCLHAAELGFKHPRTGKPLMFRSKTPQAMQKEIDARR